MQDVIKTDNTIRLFTYDDAVAIYKHNQQQSKVNTIKAIKRYLVNHYIVQKIIGFISLIVTIVLSCIIKDGTALIFMLPICMGLMLVNEPLITI
jgi:uncharacterized protein YaeQ